VRSAGPEAVQPQMLQCRARARPIMHGAAVIERWRHPYRSRCAIGRAATRSSTPGLTCASTIDDRVEVGFGLRTATAALELGSLLDRKRHVMDVTVNL
jgi:hypothetical protein